MREQVGLNSCEQQEAGVSAMSLTFLHWSAKHTAPSTPPSPSKATEHAVPCRAVLCTPWITVLSWLGRPITAHVRTRGTRASGLQQGSSPWPGWPSGTADRKACTSSTLRCSVSAADRPVTCTARHGMAHLSWQHHDTIWRGPVGRAVDGVSVGSRWRERITSPQHCVVNPFAPSPFTSFTSRFCSPLLQPIHP